MKKPIKPSPEEKPGQAGEQGGQTPPLARLKLEIAEDEQRNSERKTEEPYPDKEGNDRREDFDRPGSRNGLIRDLAELKIHRGRRRVRVTCSFEIPDELDQAQQYHRYPNGPRIEPRLQPPASCLVHKESKEENDQETKKELPSESYPADHRGFLKPQGISPVGGAVKTLFHIYKASSRSL